MDLKRIGVGVGVISIGLSYTIPLLINTNLIQENPILMISMVGSIILFIVGVYLIIAGAWGEDEDLVFKKKQLELEKEKHDFEKMKYSNEMKRKKILEDRQKIKVIYLKLSKYLIPNYINQLNKYYHSLDSQKSISIDTIKLPSMIEEYNKKLLDFKNIKNDKDFLVRLADMGNNCHVVMMKLRRENNNTTPPNADFKIFDIVLPLYEEVYFTIGKYMNI